MDGASQQTEDALVALFDQIPVAIICDAMDLLDLPSSYVQGGVLPLVVTNRAGRAHTIERLELPANATQADIEPDLSLGVQMAIDSAKPGCVIVLACGASEVSSVWGNNMGLRSKSIGVSAIVTDGLLRDVADCEELGLPVFAAGVHAQRSLKRLASVSVGKPVICGGTRIRPGDIIVGDRDGVIVIPPERAKEIAQRARAWMVTEADMQDYIKKGHSMVEAIKKFKS